MYVKSEKEALPPIERVLYKKSANRAPVKWSSLKQSLWSVPNLWGRPFSVLKKKRAVSSAEGHESLYVSPPFFACIISAPVDWSDRLWSKQIDEYSLTTGLSSGIHETSSKGSSS